MPRSRMETIKKTAAVAGGIALAILAIDFVGFVAWVGSGQVPADGFYVGRITAEIIKAII